jgi:hypothetical protein
MTISVACPSCERKFQAPAQFGGKRIKCKVCGEIFVVPLPDQVAVPTEDVDDDLSALAESVRGMDSPNRSRAGMAPTPAGKPGGSGTAPSAKNALAPNVLTFAYPGADDVDRWLPASLTVLCFLVLADVVVGPDTHDAVWIALTRFVTMAVLYCMLIFPLAWMMIKKASRETRFAMPPQAQFRCFAAYLPAFLLSAWFFSQQNSGFFVPVVGSILGLALSSGVLFLLFRLREPDIVTYSVQGAGGFLGGLLGSILLAVLLNALVQMIVTDNKAEKSVPASPFAGSLAWVAAPAPAATHNQPQTGSETNSQTSSQTVSLSNLTPRSTPRHAQATPVAPEPAPAAAGSSSSLVDSIESGKIPGPIDEVIQPLSNSPAIAILRNNQTGISIEPWNTTDWQKGDGVLQLPAGAAKKFVLSTDGQKLAWIAEFPRLSVQVWSFPDGTVSMAIPLDKSEGTAELIGFVSDDRLLIERGNSKKASGAPAAAQTASPADPTADEPPPESVFGGFKINPSELSREHAAAQHDAAQSPAPKTEPVAAPTDDATVPAHAMEIIDTLAGTTDCNFDLPALVTDFVSAGQASNVIKAPLHLGNNVAISAAAHRLVAAAMVQDIPTLIPFDLTTGRRLASTRITEVDPSQSGGLTGLAYSNDGSKLAALFEHDQSALLLAYDAANGKKISDRVYPFGPLEGAPHSQPDNGAIAWLDPAPLWLVYGQGFLSTKTGAHLKSADLNVGTVISQRVLDEHHIELVVSENGSRQVKVVDLNPAADNGDSKP